MAFNSKPLSQKVGSDREHGCGFRWIAAALVCLGGCSKTTTEPDRPDVSSTATHDVQQNDGPVEFAPNAALERLADSGISPSGSALSPDLSQEPLAVASETTSRPSGSGPGESEGQSQADPNSIAAPASGLPARGISDPMVGRTQLRPDLNPTELVEFLGVADRDMQGIWSLLPQIPDGREKLIRLAKMKLEASRRLKVHAEADAQARSVGARGELQALSHLASFSDLSSAQELEELATENLKSSDPDLVSDSRLVLIGFAIESLQNGETGAADRITGYVDQIVAAGASDDVPTLMVMGQARDALVSYGHDDHAKRVRESIIKLYADSENPDLAMAAQELAGNILYDETERLMSEVLNGRTVSVEQWKQAVEKLLSEAPEIRTVQYLASTALQLEAAEKSDFVRTTFDGMIRTFDDPDSDSGREVRIAMAAADARQAIVGVRFNPILPAVDGSELSMDSLMGRVVLVPFWAAAFPESLQLIGRLKQIQSAHPDDVAIVGVNLDGNDPLLQAFLAENDLGFPSYRSKSSAEAEVANPLAAEFGIASMPFLAILDRQGKVAAVNFTGQGIEEKVVNLLEQEARSGNP